VLWSAPPGGSWVLGGVLLGGLGAWGQVKKLAPMQWFNHNDLFHVIQGAGLACLYLGLSGH